MITLLRKIVLGMLVVLVASVGCFLLMASRISPVSAQAVGGWTWSRSEFPSIAWLAGLYLASNIASLMLIGAMLRRSNTAWVAFASAVFSFAWGIIFGAMLMTLPSPFDSSELPHSLNDFLALLAISGLFSIAVVLGSCYIVWPIAFSELWLLRRIIFGPQRQVMADSASSAPLR
jgi:hypothetical protein